MLLNVRVLGSGPTASAPSSVCDVEASLEDSVESLKRKVETKLNLGPNSDPKLLFHGKPLQGQMDDTFY